MNLNRIRGLCQHRAGREALADEFADTLQGARNGTPPPAGFDAALAYVVNSIRRHDPDGLPAPEGHSLTEWEAIIGEFEQTVAQPPRGGPSKAGRAARTAPAGRRALPPITAHCSRNGRRF